MGAEPTFSVSVAAGTTPFTYQWQKQPAGGTFANISGATSASYKLPAAVAGDNGSQYRVVVTNSAGSATSNAASLAVFAPGVRVLAGDAGDKGNVDGTGAAARFSFPANIALDGAGNLYVADFGNQTIRRVSPAGVVETMAGTEAVQGHVNGPGASARFNNPAAVAVIGNTVYVADQANNRIRAIDVTTKVVTTLAGAADAGGADGIGANARFAAPVSLAAAGTQLYVADLNGNRIRRIDVTTAQVVTVAGTGAAGAADGSFATTTFDGPSGLAVNPGPTPAFNDDIVYVVDSSNNTVRQLTMATGLTSTIAGIPGQFGSVDGPLGVAKLGAPRAVAWGNNLLFIAESGNQIIRRVNLGVPPSDPGYTVTIAGTAGLVGSAMGGGASARFKLPYGAALWGSTLYISNFGNDSIVALDVNSYTVTAFAGSGNVRGSADNANGLLARFDYPRGITTDAAGAVYIADSFNNAIRKVGPDGATTTFAGNTAVTGGYVDGPRLSARFNDPRAIAIDSAGNGFVADRSNNAIRRVDAATGAVTTVANTAQGIDRPDAIVAAPNGVLYVANSGRHTIVKIDTANANAVTPVAGGDNVPGAVDAVGALARFNFPNGLALSGNTLYVSDGLNYRIRTVDVTTGAVGTIAGGVQGYADGNGLTARFRSPGQLAVDATYLYVVDYPSNTIRRVQLAAPNAVTTVVGVDDAYGVITGNLPGGLNGPTGVAVTPGPVTRLKIADGLEHVLLEAVIP